MITLGENGLEDFEDMYGLEDLGAPARIGVNFGNSIFRFAKKIKIPLIGATRTRGPIPIPAVVSKSPFQLATFLKSPIGIGAGLVAGFFILKALKIIK